LSSTLMGRWETRSSTSMGEENAESLGFLGPWLDSRGGDAGGRLVEDRRRFVGAGVHDSAASELGGGVGTRCADFWGGQELILASLVFVISVVSASSNRGSRGRGQAFRGVLMGALDIGTFKVSSIRGKVVIIVWDSMFHWHSEFQPHHLVIMLVPSTPFGCHQMSTVLGCQYCKTVAH